MKPYPVIFHLYAESEEEVQTLRCALYDLVSECYAEGIYITAPKVTEAIDKISKNPFLKSLLK